MLPLCMPDDLITLLQLQYRRFAPKRAALKEVLRREAAARLLCIVIATANWSRVSDAKITVRIELRIKVSLPLLKRCHYQCCRCSVQTLTR
jgi:hypothetical protein